MPLSTPTGEAISGRPVLMLSGAADSIVPMENARRLAQLLASGGGQVERMMIPTGHGLSSMDVERQPDADSGAERLFGAPKGNRTPVFAVKGRRPGPLDDGRGGRARWRHLGPML